MQPLEDLQKLKRQLSRAEFLERYPHPFLVRELEDDERPALFRTIVTNVKAAPPAPPRRALALSGAALIEKLAAAADRFGAYPLAKSESNPWSDRILVGRASNNDIVIRNDRISKVHAYFQVSPRGVWRLYDARSANGTRVDGALLAPGEQGLEVKSGQTVTFGSVEMQLLGPGELYDAL